MSRFEKIMGHLIRNKSNDKSQRGEDKLMLEHKQTMEELNKDLQEKDDLMEKMREEYENKLESYAPLRGDMKINKSKCPLLIE
ncbi:hypothetical protein KUTeg_008736 [Tegillarca granosa]|uniref:Uncharacterized protein n=1 Tax=Tegillarca granosa TaxID=220873 RepID=A0ABQ9FET4_TEGGR|nr:hypothetical protein KUTeg_008736 [Tegillarca granosa]